MSIPLEIGRNARPGARSDQRSSEPRCSQPQPTEEGQATVELALVLPLVFALLVLVFQVALVARDQILVVHVARDATREATVSSDPSRIAAVAARNLPGAAVRIVRRGNVGERVEVAISYVSRTDLPLIGALVPDITLHGDSVMRVERP